jgi:hypothetical protein
VIPVVYCADIGSVRRGRFCWACSEADGSSIGRDRSEIADLVGAVDHDLVARRSVALGFECPLFVPVPREPEALGKGRKGEGNRPWSAGAGVGVLATGIVQVAWILSEIQCRHPHLRTYLDWILLPLDCTRLPLSGSLREGLEESARSRLAGQEELLERVAPGEGAESAAKRAADGVSGFASLAVSILLYLASKESDLAPAAPPPRGRGRAAEVKPAALWEVGWRIGALLREQGGEGRGAAGPRSGPRPHVRRAHWHLYWVGRRSDPARRRRELRWVAPVVVAAGEGVVPVVRRVG